MIDQIVVMSATMDVDHFSAYFNKASVVYLEGRQFPIQVYHSKQPQEDYLFSSLVTLFQIHKEAPAEYYNFLLSYKSIKLLNLSFFLLSHHVLMFLTGQEEIEAVTKNARTIAKVICC